MRKAVISHFATFDSFDKLSFGKILTINEAKYSRVN